MERRDWTLLLTLGAIWGASYMFIKIGLRDLSPAMVAFLRVALGAGVMVLYARRRGALDGIGRYWRPLAFVGLIQVAGPFLLISAGQQEIASGMAGILVATAPIFTAILATFVDQEERSHGLRMAGIVTGVVGVALLLGVDLGGSGAELLGGLAVVAAGLGYAIGSLAVKRRLSGVDPIGIATMVLVWAALMLFPAAVIGAPDVAPGAGPILAVVTLGVVGTGIAFAIFYAIMSRVGPARTLLVTYLAPGFAVVYGALLLDEVVTVATIAGLGLILSGSFLAAEGRLPWQPRTSIPIGPPASPAGVGGPLEEAAQPAER